MLATTPRLPRPVLPWEGLKRLHLNTKSETLFLTDNHRRPGQCPFMSLTSGKNGETVHGRAQLLPDGIQVTASEHNHDAGIFSSVAEAWFAMIACAARSMEAPQAELMRSVEGSARTAMSAAAALTEREDVVLIGNMWRHRIAAFANGTFLARQIFLSCPSSDKFMPSLHDKDGFIVACTGRSKQDHMPAYCVQRSRNRGGNTTYHADENEVLSVLSELACGAEDASGHERMAARNAVKHLVDREGNFRARFDFPPLMNPIHPVVTAGIPA